MPSSKDKGKAPAHHPSPADSRRRALERAVSRHYDKKKRRAERRTLLDDQDLLDALDSIDQSSIDDDSDDNQDTGNVSAPGRSEEEWDAIRSTYTLFILLKRTDYITDDPRIKRGNV
jgi:hypothetical protein